MVNNFASPLVKLRFHCTSVDVTNNTHHHGGGGGNRGPLSGDIPSLERCTPFIVYFYSFQTFITSFTHFTLHLLCIYIALAGYFLIPNDAVDQQKMDFGFYFF